MTGTLGKSFPILKGLGYLKNSISGISLSHMFVVSTEIMHVKYLEHD